MWRAACERQRSDTKFSPHAESNLMSPHVHQGAEPLFSYGEHKSVEHAVAAKGDYVVDMQFFGQHLVEPLIAEAAVRHYPDLDSRRQQFGQPDRDAICVQIAAVLERALVEAASGGEALANGADRQ